METPVTTARKRQSTSAWLAAIVPVRAGAVTHAASAVDALTGSAPLESFRRMTPILRRTIGAPFGAYKAGAPACASVMKSGPCSRHHT